MAENIMIDKVIGESGASNSNATAQSQSVQSTVRRQRKKSEWKMHKRSINFCPISSQRGEDMENSIVNCLKEWGLERIFTVTVDNASSYYVTVKELSKKLTKWGTNSMNGKHLHVRCMAHIMNLVVHGCIKESIVSIEHIRQAVRYIRQSPARWKKFQECCDKGNLVRKSLCLGVPTRWNSTHLMLNRAIEYESAILEYVDHDIGLSHHLEFVDIVDGSPAGTLLSSDWEGVKKLTKFLEIFYKLTLKVSNSLYVTSNHHFLEICKVVVYLIQLILNDDVLLGSMEKKMKEKFDKYLGDPEKMNNMIFISCVLDPRYKFDSVSFALAKMFEEKEPIIAKAVHTYMTSSLMSM
ncbi:zinc finger BED domain-containing protein RICESLEEPER 2-like [Nicotiana tabacum]|uniref:Zinc finger BED domain-containing protein RICESLEEPER 2-like n=1 Tax=Nicotiana tabacum TaxID=4097 RepID=A0AC58TGT3_TOBAC